MPASSVPSRVRGFTLIEASLTIVIIGVGVLAMMSLLAAGTKINGEASKLTVANQLLNTMRDLTLGLAFTDPSTPNVFGADSGETLASYDDINDLNGKSFSPPIDARRQVMAGLSGWTQRVTVQSVDPDDIAGPAVANGSTGVNRVTVTVSCNGDEVSSQSWLATAVTAD